MLRRSAIPTLGPALSFLRLSTLFAALLFAFFPACSSPHDTSNLNSNVPETENPVLLSFLRADRLRRSGTKDDQDEALALYRKALDSWREEGNENAARCLKGIGQIHSARGDDLSASQAFNEALEAIPDDGALQVDILNLLGRSYRNLSRRRDAIAHHRKAVAVSERLRDSRRTALSLVELALQVRADGGLDAALQDLERAIAIWRRLKDNGRLAHALWEAGRTCSLLDRLEEALDRYTEAEALYRDAGETARQAGVLTEIGWLHYLNDDTEEALHVLNRSAELFRHSRGFVPVGTLDRLGSVFRKARRFEESLSRYNEALSQLDDKREFARAAIRVNLSELHLDWNRPQAAMDFLRQAAPIIERRGGISDQVHTIYLTARAQIGLEKYEQAEATLERVLQMVDSVRYRMELPGNRQSYQSASAPYQQAYIELLMLRHSLDGRAGFGARALEAAERIRARTLEEALDPRRAPSPSEAASVKRLTHQLDELDRQRSVLIERKGVADELSALDERQNRLRWKLERLMEEGGQESKPKAPMKAAEIRAMLDSDTLLLYYFVGRENVFLWSVTRESVTSYRLGSASELTESVRHYQRLMNASQTPPVRSQALLSLRRLGDRLLEPVRDRLDRARLVIVPDAGIQYVPFLALADGRGRLLIERTRGTYAPSVDTWRTIEVRERSRRQPPKAVFVLADPVFSRDDPRVIHGVESLAEGPSAHGDSTEMTRAGRSLGVTDGLGRWPRLRQTRREGEAILAALPQDESTALFDFDASRRRLFESDLSQFRVLHFATHALQHSRYPDLSGIVLSLVDRRGLGQAGFLRSDDIVRLPLKADLVVLSACRTAIGKQVPGEGVVGLSQAFIRAGASRTVVSLWKVGDEATAELMSRFYREMGDDSRRPARALRRAQLSMRHERRWQDPRYWAGFVVVGSPDAR